MARTISEIKKSMTDQFMSDSVLLEKYGLKSGDSFDSKFSKVSLENILFSIVAAAIYAVESMMDFFKADVEKRISESIVASIPWYHQICLEYQHGDELIFDEATKEFKYAVEDDSKRVIKYASVRDNAAGVNILVSTDDNGKPKALSNDVLTVFKQYLNARKPAGVLVNVRSYDPDILRMKLRVQFDAMVLNSDGSLIDNPTVFPVEQAIQTYISGIVYGGIFNKTRLVDAVQNAVGVEDVVLDEVMTRPVTRSEFIEVAGNNVKSVSGSFVVNSLRENIEYVQEL